MKFLDTNFWEVWWWDFNVKLSIISYVRIHMYSILVVVGNLVFAKELGDEITT